MIDSAQGIILRTRRLTETSLIVHWLTPGFGRVSTVAKGALRAKSPFRGKLDLFYEADFSFVRSRASELHNLREVGLRETHPMLRRDLGCLRQASYGASLVEQCTERETPLPDIFDLTCGFIGAVCAGPVQAQTVLAFELKLLDELGLAPSTVGGGLLPGTREVGRVLVLEIWAGLSRLKLSERQVTELARFLGRFMIFEFGRAPAGRTAALGLTPPRRV